jgi:putative hydrolase of the HAD superfamily
MLKAIAFDLWETLITDTPELSKAQERLRLTRMEEILTNAVASRPSAVGRGGGFLLTADCELRTAVEHAHRALWHRCHDLYWSSDIDVPCRRQIEHFLEELELDAASFDERVLEELEHAYASAALEILPKTVEGAEDMLTTLKSRGLGVGLISNTGRTPGSVLRSILGELGLASSIDVMVFSNEHGECKPQSSIFEELRRGLGVAAEEMLFVGDNLYVDVYGAQRSGMKAVHFQPPVRGTAVAPAVEHTLEIVPDATVQSLRELLAVIDALS